MTQHYDEARTFSNTGKQSDTFARHFGEHAREDKDPTRLVTTGDIRKNVRMEVLWQGKIISCMKTFGKLSCKLCMQERIEIHKELELEKSRPMRKLINSGAEIYGACRHIPKFHRLKLRNPVLMKEMNPEKSLITGNPRTSNATHSKMCTGNG